MTDLPNERSPWHDPLVAEVRAVRTALYAAAGNDIHEFCRRAREAQGASGHRILTVVAERLDDSGERSSRSSGHAG